MHEWRPMLGQMLRELVASGGMKPQGGGSTRPPPDLRYRENWGPLAADKPDGWAWSHVLSEQYRQFTGIFGGCWFAQMNQKPDGLNSIVDAFNAITGWNFTMDQALEAGQRSMILQSLFGTQRGWIADFDWQDVGPRFLEPIPDGKYKGFTIASGCRILFLNTTASPAGTSVPAARSRIRLISWDWKNSWSGASWTRKNFRRVEKPGWDRSQAGLRTNVRSSC
jgi:Aldehyde ferredoxin oxidoreductase, domains 2 & 3